MTIDITMYAVGLGTSILLQFGRGTRTVRVLVDGGDAGAGEEVADKLSLLLKPSVQGGNDEQPWIDLVIASHYDADHLDGLTAIMRRGDAIPIREIWLPPVADDTDVKDFGREPRFDSMLAARFSNENGNDAFSAYLETKRERLASLEQLERDLEVQPEPHSERQLLQKELADDGDFAEMVRPFRHAHRVASSVLGSHGLEHAPGADVLDHSLAVALLTAIEPRKKPWWIQDMRRHVRSIPAGEAIAQMAIATLRMKIATEGINAVALKRLLEALANRPEITRQFRWCENGKPLFLGWNTASKRFDGRCSEGGSPTLTLLGPTERLIAERRDSLPSSSIAFLAGRFDRLEGLTNSNQLSYVVRLDYDEQGLLLTGDSGFDGFATDKDSARTYDAGLTAHLRDLAVIQVPHHGGISRHFFRIMDDVGFSKATLKSFLLLSHERGSVHRPGHSFGSFMTHLGTSHPTRLLFTSTPRPENVASYKLLAAPPSSSPSGEGDVKLSYTGTWSVTAHQVQL